jgi:hypothetical protein
MTRAVKEMAVVHVVLALAFAACSLSCDIVPEGSDFVAEPIL